MQTTKGQSEMYKSQHEKSDTEVLGYYFLTHRKLRHDQLYPEGLIFLQSLFLQFHSWVEMFPLNLLFHCTNWEGCKIISEWCKIKRRGRKWTKVIIEKKSKRKGPEEKRRVKGRKKKFYIKNFLEHKRNRHIKSQSPQINNKRWMFLEFFNNGKDLWYKFL